MASSSAAATKNGTSENMTVTFQQELDECLTQVKDILDRLGSSPDIPSDQKQVMIRGFFKATRAALKEADAVNAKEESNVDKPAVETTFSPPSSQDSPAPPATDKSSNSVTTTTPSTSASATGNSTPATKTAGTGTNNTKKRPADDMVVVTPSSASSKKPRKKPTPSPKTMYNRVKAKLEAGHTSKKYQSHYGSKDHAPDVYRLMLNLLKDHALPLIVDVVDDKKQVRRALDMGTSIFQAFEGYCQELISPGYEPDVLREAVDEFAKILQVAVASNVLNDPSEMETLMTMLEVIDASIDGMGRRMKEDACVYYTTGDGKEDDWAPEEYQGKRYQAGENVLHQAIRTFQPDYDPSQRPPQMPKVSASTLGFLRGMILSK